MPYSIVTNASASTLYQNFWVAALGQTDVDLVVTSLFPLQLLLATFAGWANRHQARVIDYLVEENRVLKEQLGCK